MKVQDKYPVNSTIVGSNNIFQKVGSNSFYVNSPCILATHKIIIKEKSYVLFEIPTETGVKIRDVQLMDAYFKRGIINLILRDIKSQRVFAIDYCTKCPKNDCKWVLIDVNYFSEVIINEGMAWSKSSDEEELRDNLDDICLLKLDFNLHASKGESVVIAGTRFYLN